MTFPFHPPVLADDGRHGSHGKTWQTWQTWITWQTWQTQHYMADMADGRRWYLSVISIMAVFSTQKFLPSCAAFLWTSTISLSLSCFFSADNYPSFCYPPFSATLNKTLLLVEWQSKKKSMTIFLVYRWTSGFNEQLNIMAKWQNGRMTDDRWQNDRMIDGRMAEWQSGRMAEWQNGRSRWVTRWEKSEKEIEQEKKRKEWVRKEKEWEKEKRTVFISSLPNLSCSTFSSLVSFAKLLKRT